MVLRRDHGYARESRAPSPMGNFPAQTRWSRYFFAAAAATALAAAAYAIIALTNGRPAVRDERGDEPLEDQWSRASGDPIHLRFDPSTGPVWGREDSRDVPLSPNPSGDSVDWRRTEVDSGLRFVGSVRRRGTDIEYVWRFRTGDPQARFSVHLPEVDLETLRSKVITVAFELPKGRLRAPDRRMRIRPVRSEDLPRNVGPLAPSWMEWSDGSEILSIANWNGDGSTLRRSGDTRRIELHVWRPRLHGALRDCSLREDDSSPTVELRADTTVTFGGEPPVVRSLFPHGRVAGLAPIFDLPAAHPDSTLRAGQPDSPGDWARRAKTLAYGHSDSGDPRYGNGGLLGHDLAATVAVPADWRNAETVRAFARAVEDSGIEIAARGRRADEPNGDASTERRSTIDEQPRCRDLLGAGSAAPPVAVTDFQPFRGAFDAESIHPPREVVPASASPFRLDGSRSALIDSALASPTLERLVEHRDFATFATPLVGTRNPLVPAADQALLSPEREGEWTLSEPFSKSLANLSILRDSEPIWVGGLSTIANYWRGTRRSRTGWTSGGDLLVRTDAERAVDGYTLVVGRRLDGERLSLRPEADLQLRRSGAAPGRGDSAGETFLWWNARPDATYRLEFGPDSDLQPPEPVRWTIAE